MEKRNQYPLYYKSVEITYKSPIDNITLCKNNAWLAVNDNGKYIWTLSSDNNTIIPDIYVINWKYI